MKVPLIRTLIFVYTDLVYIATLFHVSLGQDNLPLKPYGSRFDIQCIRSNGVAVDHWTLNGNEITATFNGIDSTSISETFLRIEFMSLALEGQYQCFGANPDQLLYTVNVFVIGRALYPVDDCLLTSIRTCTNNVTYSRADVIPLNANIQFDNIGSKNEVELVINTIWNFKFPNKTTGDLACPANNMCTYSFSGLTVVVTMSGDRHNDSAMVEIGSADYNFNITHTFMTQGLAGQIEEKVFIFHYIPTPVTSSSVPNSTATYTTTMPPSETTTNTVVMTTNTIMLTKSTTPTVTTIPTSTEGGNTRSDDNSDHTVAIALGVVIGVIVVILLLIGAMIGAIILVVFCCKHYRNDDIKSRPNGLSIRSQLQDNRALMDNTTTAVTPSERQLPNGAPPSQQQAISLQPLNGKPLNGGSVNNDAVHNGVNLDDDDGVEPILSDTDASVDV